jgi:uncharacterized membrane-anchored protein
VLPANHPQRVELNDEVHARPPEALSPPLRISYLALLTEPAERPAAWRAVCDLAARLGAAPPPEGAIHWSEDLGPFRLKWEQHTEFYRCMFIAPGGGRDPFADPAIAAVPAGWVAALPGRVIVAAHAALLPDAEEPADPAAIAEALFAGNVLVGGAIADGVATALTDFRIHGDGFGRILVLDRGLAARQAGRMLQRLLEIETYRMMALLALPLARETVPFLTAREAELAAITAALVSADPADEPVMLERLTGLSAEIESREAATLSRFSAASAYYELVQRRIAELRERRLPGLQTWQEFTERRLAPAMNTCRAVAARQEGLSRRVARATQLLSTRVDLTREAQNSAVLESMNRRAKLQLRMQQTVEGLSVAAITYYVVGLVNYASKAVDNMGFPVDPEVVTAASIPLVLLLVGLGVRRIRRAFTRATG